MTDDEIYDKYRQFLKAKNLGYFDEPMTPDHEISIINLQLDYFYLQLRRNGRYRDCFIQSTCLTLFASFLFTYFFADNLAFFYKATWSRWWIIFFFVLAIPITLLQRKFVFGALGVLLNSNKNIFKLEARRDELERDMIL